MLSMVAVLAVLVMLTGLERRIRIHGFRSFIRYGCFEQTHVECLDVYRLFAHPEKVPITQHSTFRTTPALIPLDRYDSRIIVERDDTAERFCDETDRDERRAINERCCALQFD